jgi:hypothetical protein
MATPAEVARKKGRRRIREWCEDCRSMAELHPVAIWWPGSGAREYLRFCKCGTNFGRLEGYDGPPPGLRRHSHRQR